MLQGRRISVIRQRAHNIFTLYPWYFHSYEIADRFCCDLKVRLKDAYSQTCLLRPHSKLLNKIEMACGAFHTTTCLQRKESYQSPYTSIDNGYSDITISKDESTRDETVFKIHLSLTTKHRFGRETIPTLPAHVDLNDIRLC